MPASDSLADLLLRSREVRGEEIWYRFANGLTIKTEIFNKGDVRRILPLGSPQGALMNHLAHFPGIVRHKHVFEPFAGAGPLGFMALMLGARHVDVLDINPRAAEFHHDSAQVSQLSPSRFTSITGDVADFVPDRRHQVILANPPFVPTPDGIDGTITSNGGPDGNRLVGILFRRLAQFLEPSGDALIYLFQFVKSGRTLIADVILKTVHRRPVELTPSQKRPISFEAYRAAYIHLFPNATQAVERWESDLLRRYGEGLTLCHYVAHIGSEKDVATSCVIRDNFAQKFGESFLVPSDSEEQLALGRVLENVVL